MATLYLLDVNVLLPLLNPEHEGSAKVHAWFETIEEFATTPATESGVIRLLMNPVIGGLSFSEALNLVSGIFTDPRAIFLPDTATLRSARIDLDPIHGFRQVTDFQLINLAATHNAVLATYDRKILRSLSPSDHRHVAVIGA